MAKLVVLVYILACVKLRLTVVYPDVTQAMYIHDYSNYDRTVFKRRMRAVYIMFFSLKSQVQFVLSIGFKSIEYEIIRKCCFTLCKKMVVVN